MNLRQSLTFSVTTFAVFCYAYSQEPAEKSTAVQPAQATKATSSSPENAKAQEILAEARKKLQSHASVRAQIAEKVQILNHSFSAKGSYVQGKDLQLKLEFRIELVGQKASMLDVCDGQVLWSRHDVVDQTTITRRDVRQILAAGDKLQGKTLTSGLISEMGLGGLPGLLAAFAQDIVFDKVENSTIDEQAVTVLEGTWNTDLRTQWAGKKAADKKEAPALPSFIPDRIRLSLDEKTSFPRRIEYLKQYPGQTTLRSLLTVDFTKVVFNGPVSNEEFVFLPPDRPAPIDVTQMYLQRLTPAGKKDKPAAGAKP